MEKISLESVDEVIERTGVSYSKAKEALEYSNGDILDAVIYLENEEDKNGLNFEKTSETIDEFKVWLKEAIKKGNISRIKIKKDEKVIVDVPVNAGIAIAVMSIVMPAILAFGVIAAVTTKITIEITKTDGTVEVINKYIKDATENMKEKAEKVGETVRDKFSSGEIKFKSKKEDSKESNKGGFQENVYSYTVKFNEDKADNSKE
ncbi:protein of unknown function [Clostridium sp. DSM 8431]|uniref:DUF4342 domain-containing protein n=1 Tax=Clostridium sp. DSM 8431 TaxID=1761781 RepID=UPI0008EB7E2A|nr:DUF4342 domain-containing protein [Clostridium sp. DSM 8431]SFU48481.1 protein of unknown function [Clostridium sp. DSM 8431]